MAKQIMPSKGVPFPIEDWPSVVIEGSRVLNENNWFPAMTLIVGNPGETDEDVMATLDLIYEMERRGLFAFFIPSIFTPLHDTRMEKRRASPRRAQLTPLQWQLMMKCWKMNLRPGQYSWWGPTAWRVGAHRPVALEAAQAERAELHMAAADVRRRAAGMADGDDGQDLSRASRCTIKTRKELLATVKPSMRQYLRADTGDMPDGEIPPPARPSPFIPLVPQAV